MKATFVNILRGVTLFLLFFAGVGGYMIYENTLSPWWIPVGIALMIAAITSPFYKKWGWLTAYKSKTVNLLCHLIGMGSLGYALFLAGNYGLADPSSTYEEEVVVQQKFQKTHKKTRRVGRRRVVADGERKNYYLQVTFKNGMEKEIPVSLSVYNKTRTGGTNTFTFQRGFFGFPVIRRKGTGLLCQSESVHENLSR